MTWQRVAHEVGERVPGDRGDIARVDERQPAPVAVTISPARTPSATLWSPVKFCKNQDGRSTVHSAAVSRTSP
ncbi:hypothetical protein ACIBCD_21900 [Nocardia brasiliensis]|uniref:hypothetical protein n=1 Tax=Nocardia brasiliensis TaxID=37326 RepID=UPI0037BCC48A